MRRWQAVTARVELRAGGEYRWTIVPGHTAAGTITEVEPGKRLVFSWGWEDSEELPPGASTVTITLEPAEGGTRVRLVHSGLTPEQAASHLEGWDHYAERLVAAATNGDAGLDEWYAGEPGDQLTAAEASLAVCQLVLRDLGPEDRQRPDARASSSPSTISSSTCSVRCGHSAAPPVRPCRRPEVVRAEVQVADAAQAALEAGADVGSTGTVNLGPSECPPWSGRDILVVELLVHAWDFAQATDRTVTVDEP